MYTNPMNVFAQLLVRTLAVGVAAYVVPGVSVSNIWSAIAVAIVLGFLNSFLRPLLLVLTIPINILTLGLFTLVINVIIIFITAAIVPGFDVSGFWAALIFSIALWIVNLVLESMAR